MNSNWILYKNQSIIMLGNQIDMGWGKFHWSIWIQCMTLQKIEVVAKNMTHFVCHFKIFEFTYWIHWDLN